MRGNYQTIKMVITVMLVKLLGVEMSGRIRGRMGRERKGLTLGKR